MEQQREVAAERDPFAPSPTGAWADARSPQPPPPGEARAFVDPGSFALQNHVLPLMESVSLPVGAIGGASADLDSAPARETGGGGSGGGGSGGGGGGSGGGAAPSAGGYD